MPSHTYPIVGAKEVRLSNATALVAIVDEEDYEKVTSFGTWRAIKPRGNVWYAINERRYGPRSLNQKKCTYLHRFVMNYDGPLEVDHLDGDGLNCRKSNLEIKTHQQNQVNRVFLQTNNTSGTPGIYYHKLRNKWSAEIFRNGKKKYLGLFLTKLEAIVAREAAEKELDQ